MATGRVVNLLAVLVVAYTLVTYSAYRVLERSVHDAENEHRGGSSSGGARARDHYGEAAGSVLRYLKNEGTGGGAGAAQAPPPKRATRAEAVAALGPEGARAKAKRAESESDDKRGGERPPPSLPRQRSGAAPYEAGAAASAAAHPTGKKHAEFEATSSAGTNNNRPQLMNGRRFPKYGTAEFTEVCPWTTTGFGHDPNCTIVVQPSPSSNEGVASWATQIVQGYLFAKQARCGLKFNYGPGVDVGSVLTPYPGLSPTSPLDQGNNWTIHNPRFTCAGLENCFLINGKGNDMNDRIKENRRLVSMGLVDVPNYRHAYVGILSHRFHREDYKGLELALPGFSIDLGMACSLGVLFHWSHAASHYEPELFTSILPTLRDERALVMALYIRTGFTDRVVWLEEKGHGREVADDTLKGVARTTSRENVACALALEEEFLNSAAATNYLAGDEPG